MRHYILWLLLNSLVGVNVVGVFQGLTSIGTTYWQSQTIGPFVTNLRSQLFLYCAGCEKKWFYACFSGHYSVTINLLTIS